MIWIASSASLPRNDEWGTQFCFLDCLGESVIRLAMTRKDKIQLCYIVRICFLDSRGLDTSLQATLCAQYDEIFTTLSF